jgi:tetratricopeptide (TPR) repeat protein
VSFSPEPGTVLLLVYLSAQQTQSEKVMASAHTVATNIDSPNLRVIYMSADTRQLGYFRDLKTELQANEPLALDEGHQIYGQLGLIVFPTTVVSSLEGNLLHVISGWMRDYEYRLEAYCRHALGDLDAAALAQQLERSPQAKDEARARADRHRSAAAILRSKGLLNDAARELESAIVADPSSAAAVVDLADVLVAQGRLDEAEQKLSALLAQVPDVRGVTLIQGIICMKRGEMDKAEALLEKALLLNPDPTRAHYYLGQLYEKKGKHKLAMEHYRDALKSAKTDQ